MKNLMIILTEKRDNNCRDENDEKKSTSHDDSS